MLSKKYIYFDMHFSRRIEFCCTESTTFGRTQGVIYAFGCENSQPPLAFFVDVVRYTRWRCKARRFVDIN